MSFVLLLTRADNNQILIYSEIRHQSIATLMGISHDNELRVMSLIMEQFDYSLNHYLHQMVSFKHLTYQAGN